MNGTIPLLLHSLWVSFQTITGFAGLTPRAMVEVLLGIVLALILFTVAQIIRSRNSFSLDPKESEWNHSL